MSNAVSTDGPPPAIQRLEPIVGAWASEGEMFDPETGSNVPIVGTDDYEWLDGGWFIVHRVDVRIGAARVQVLELIGAHDPRTDRYSCWSFDNSGNADLMSAAIDADGVWQIFGDGIRTRLTIDPSGESMAAVWERSDDGSAWEHWMDMRFTRRSAPGGAALPTS